MQYTCDTPLYPNVEGTLSVRNDYTVENSTELTQNLGYKFRIQGKRDIWPHVASFAYFGECETEDLTLRMAIWEWNSDLSDAEILAYSNNNVTILAGGREQHIYNFTFDLTYINGGGREANYRMQRNGTYTLVVEFLGAVDCVPLYPVVVVPDDDLPYDQSQYFESVSGINQLEALGNVPTKPTNNHPNITLCVIMYDLADPTPSPTPNPTDQPTHEPTREPTDVPTPAPTGM